ncbi:glycosyltransferase [Hanstruepera neustonica]|uniref:Glycosyltransferase n=1 Tax=Hanstruepera neustonica TaxID=1445657 RepID=A0A2K1DWJ7_9FLAO|nr:glycosyltransferase [Hanstruepera neustonica]PNQ72416.1 glycosyltransferase [Hanstruepera neustonica]
MPKLLIIGYVWPEIKSSAAGWRMMQLIETFQYLKYQITFASPCEKMENAFDLKELGIDSVSIEVNSSSFDHFVAAFQPHVVMFDRFMMEEQFGWRVAENCPKALRILDTEDLHGLRKGRQLAFKDQKTFDRTYLMNDTFKRELASIYRCDLSMIISEFEMDLLVHDLQVDKSLLAYLPFMEDRLEEDRTAELPSFESRQHFITIGNFLHEPNYQAVLYLKQTIWPLIRKQLPKAELHVYGAYPSQKVTQLYNEKEGFIIKGFADDVNQVMQQAKVCLAPLQFGAGLKGKLIDAMKNGTPCAMSTIAAEGMFGNFEPHGFITDDPTEFTEQAVKLYTDELLWKNKQQNGFTIINERYNKEIHQREFINLLQKLQGNLGNHRLNNTIGQILQHYTLQSTKYMSKWIEEKNNK